MRCSIYVNRDRMYGRVNGKPLDVVDCFKYMVSQAAVDIGSYRVVVHRLNEWYTA